MDEFTVRKWANKGKIKVKNPEDNGKKWINNFRNLLGKPPAITSKPTRKAFQHGLQINTENFTKEELKKYLKGFKNNKASGLDNIPIVVWKTGTLNIQLLEFCNKTWNGGRAEIWVKNGIIPLSKKEEPWRHRKILWNIINSGSC